MSKAPSVRLHLLVARAAQRILIIRRGPSRVFHLVLWHTDSDTFEHGSWFRGKLYIHSCDLAWDGEWFNYFALGPTKEHWSWTAIARPPWLRAEIFYPSDNTWGGGGLWTAPKTLCLLGVGPARAGDPSPARLGLRTISDHPLVRNQSRLFHARLERDGWKRAGPEPRQTHQRSALGWLVEDEFGWFIQPQADLPILRIFYLGYYLNFGDRYRYQLDGFPDLIDEQVNWAGYDHAGRLILARGGQIERYTAADLVRGEPSLRYDLSALQPPPAPPRPAIPRAAPPTTPTLGPDSQGLYQFLGDPAQQRATPPNGGHRIHNQADLQALGPILREDRTWGFEKPQTYVVSAEGIFVLGGYRNDHVEVAGGQAVRAAGEAYLEEQADGTWAIVSLNNRAYGYMPNPDSWEAVAQALAPTGIRFPQDGFSQIYPLEGTWAEILAILRDESDLDE